MAAVFWFCCVFFLSLSFGLRSLSQAWLLLCYVYVLDFGPELALESQQHQRPHPGREALLKCTDRTIMGTAQKGLGLSTFTTAERVPLHKAANLVVSILRRRSTAVELVVGFVMCPLLSA